jgi:hypothetical protein
VQVERLFCFQHGGGMAINLGSAYGKVALDTKGLVQGVDKGKASLSSLETSAKQLGAQMKDVGQKLTVGLTLPILALGTASIKMASDMVETKSKVKVVFGDMADYVEQWSEGSAKSMQLSQQQALEAAGTFGNLFIAMKIGKKDAAEMSTVLVQLAGDLGSINNMDPSLVLVKLKSGIVGETEAVRDLGIDLRATTVEAKAMEMGFQKLNGQFTQGDLIAARYAIILEQTSVAQGDIARTGGELAGQLKTLNANWKDILAILGQNLLPVAKIFVTILNEWLEKFKNLSPFQQKVIVGFLAFVAILGPLLILMGTLLPMIHFTTKSLNPFSGGIFGLVFGFVKLVSVLAIVVKVLSFFGVSLGPLGTGILGLNTAIAGTGAALFPIIVILLAIAAVVVWWAVLWKSNIFDIQGTWKTFVSVIKSLWGALTAFLRGDTEAATEYLQEAWNTLVDKIQERWQNWFGWIVTAWNNFTNFLRNALPRLRDYIVTAFKNTNWMDVGKSILLGLANGMLLGIPSLILAATKAVEAVLKTFDDKLDMHSPSGVMEKRGIWSALGYAKGWQQGMNPDDVAQMMAKPLVNNNSTQQQNITMQFSGGITTRQVQGMIAENNEQMMNTLINALGGAS